MYVITPTTTSRTTFHAETKVQTKIKTRTVTTNKCKAQVVTKPDGTTIVSVKANNKVSNVTHDSVTANSSTKLSQALGQPKGIALGISYYYNNKEPLRFSKQLIEVSLSIPITDNFNLVGGYRLDNTFRLGLEYRW